MSLPLIVIVGPTAMGKSNLAIEIAKKYNGEVVSADSWMVRKRLDIGTAKPTLDERREVPHHLIDIIEPYADFSAAEYKKLAMEQISDIHKRGKLPILAGGSGLYIDSVIYDYSFLGPADPKFRQQLNNMTLEELIKFASDKGLDVASVDVRNKRRVIRLIESDGGVASKGQLRQNTLVIGMTESSEFIKKRIVDRVEKMINLGLEDEVKQLNLDYGWDCEGLKGIGYSEWKLYFEGNQNLDITKERIIKDTIALAKRQHTWFKRNKSIQWFTTPVNLTDLDAIITTLLNK